MSQGVLMDITKYGDIGTPERHIRKELQTTIVDGKPKTIVRDKSPLEYYRNRNQITADQLAAGERLYNSFIVGWVGFKSYEQKERISGGGQALEMAEKQVQAQKDFARGMDAVGSHKFIIDNVVLEERFIANIVKHWYPRKQMKQCLVEALQNMSKCYGYS